VRTFIHYDLDPLQIVPSNPNAEPDQRNDAVLRTGRAVSTVRWPAG
jgi:hypothetical protein